MTRIQRARESKQRKRRRRLYESAITTVLEERVHLPAYRLKNSFGVKDSVQGFEPHPMTDLNPRLVGPDGAVSVE